MDLLVLSSLYCLSANSNQAWPPCDVSGKTPCWIWSAEGSSNIRDIWLQWSSQTLPHFQSNDTQALVMQIADYRTNSRIVLMNGQRTTAARQLACYYTNVCRLQTMLTQRTERQLGFVFFNLQIQSFLVNPSSQVTNNAKAVSELQAMHAGSHYYDLSPFPLFCCRLAV